LTEQDIVSNMGKALEDKQFVLYYQPQFDHSNGSLVGTEALVRWIHPERGIISPGIFIPIFEKTGFITNLDLYVFEQVCVFLRKRLDEDIPVVPISSNFSRYDIFMPDFVNVLESIRMKYKIPVRFLRVEITESAVVGGSRETNEIVKQLHEKGYIVEMDDFGSGYSSLNVLKDIDLDIIKLDLRFLAEENGNNRGGTIISSVVRMAKWLSMPVIAEGVETVSQADFLKSIGCDYIQGYLYSKPIPESDYAKLLSNSIIEATVPQMRLVETLNACNFWDPKSQETLIFSNYVGGAAIFDYHDDKIELLRINQKYLRELGMNLSEYDLIKADPLTTFTDEIDVKVYKQMIQKAIKSGEEEECETWRTMSSDCCGTDTICIRSNIRMIGKSKDSYLFYAMIRNITAEKRRFIALTENDKKFHAISEQANIYSWEYNLQTRDMFPCYRCMRDLSLPPVVHNYPEPAIEAGIFPPEVADDYREWLKQLYKGIDHIEKIYPLTVGRIPFHVRYTLEYDESGKPIKALGSATLVVDKK
ncbi:MAG: EAL domain-containing protein, partial [Spirochaetales bacterium]|nr:EAL domain-containing protein [Spirochaetales bacterium]